MIRNISISLLVLSAPIAQARTVWGVADRIEQVDGREVMYFRTAKETLQLDTKRIPKKWRDLASPKNKKKRHNLQIPEEAIVKAEKVPRGIRNDCSELPVTVEELEAIAKQSPDMQSFLDKIPEGTLQGFTFVTNSRSLHRGNDKDGGRFVSDEWPRVLRTSIDGKTSISFVCDPLNETYGKVEIIFFDDKTKDFKTVEYDFGHKGEGTIKEKRRFVPPNDRIHHGPQSCVSCHAGGMVNGKRELSINWPQYFFWGDCDPTRPNAEITMYGASDDTMGGDFRSRNRVGARAKYDHCSTASDAAAVAKMNDQYENFRRKQASNKCFNSLPWPEGNRETWRDGKDAANNYYFYPYMEAQDWLDSTLKQNYSVRANARLTDVYSHLTSLRNARMLQDSPEYEKAKYFIALEETHCLKREDRDRIQALFPGMQLPSSFPSFNTSSYSVDSAKPFLSTYANRIGFSLKEWSMEYDNNLTKDYNAVMFMETGYGDAKIHNVMSAEILRDIASSNREVRQVTEGIYSKGVEDGFGPAFKCIDELGHAVKPNEKGKEERCEVLRREMDEHLKALNLASLNCTDCNPDAVPLNPFAPEAAASEVQDQIAEIMKTVDQASIDRGKALASANGKGKCVTCHSPQALSNLTMDRRFVPADDDPQRDEAIAILRARLNEGDLLDRIHDRLIDSAAMPPIRNDLTPADRLDIRNYLIDLGSN